MGKKALSKCCKEQKITDCNTSAAQEKWKATYFLL